MIITGNALISVEEKDIVDGVLQIPEGIITIEKFACSGCQERIKKKCFSFLCEENQKICILKNGNSRFDNSRKCGRNRNCS